MKYRWTLCCCVVVRKVDKIKVQAAGGGGAKDCPSLPWNQHTAQEKFGMGGTWQPTDGGADWAAKGSVKGILGLLGRPLDFCGETTREKGPRCNCICSY